MFTGANKFEFNNFLPALNLVENFMDILFGKIKPHNIWNRTAMLPGGPKKGVQYWLQDPNRATITGFCNKIKYTIYKFQYQTQHSNNNFLLNIGPIMLRVQSSVEWDKNQVPSGSDLRFCSNIYIITHNITLK